MNTNFKIVIFLQFLFVISVLSQDVKKSLFSEVDKKMQQAKAASLDILSPSLYDDANSEYIEATEEFKDGANLKDIQEMLDNVLKYLNTAETKAEISSITLKSSIKARNDAMKVDAQKHSPELWDEAEKMFRDAGEEVEDGDIPDAEEASKEAEEIYRSAELNSIKILLESGEAIARNSPKVDLFLICRMLFFSPINSFLFKSISCAFTSIVFKFVDLENVEIMYALSLS